MITTKTFTQLALSFDGAEEKPHFERTSFRVKNKIFATLHVKNRIATLKLTPVDQSVFCDLGKGYIYPVPNKWGKQGWTLVELDNISEDMLKDALQTAWKTITQPKT